MDGYISSHTGAEIDELLNNAAGLTDDIDRIETLVNRANTTAEGAEETAGGAEETATEAKTIALAAKARADELYNRLFGKGASVSQYFDRAKSVLVPCDIKAGTYMVDGGNYRTTVAQYLYLRAINAEGQYIGDAFSSNHLIGGQHEKALTFDEDIKLLRFQAIDNDEWDFIAPGTITLKFIDTDSLEWKIMQIE